MKTSLSGLRALRSRRFSGSDVQEIFEFLRESAGTSENVAMELICDESLCDEDIHPFEQKLIEYHRSVHLSRLELPHNGLTSVSGPGLSRILALQHETLLNLSLAHNPLTHVGMERLLEPLVSQSLTSRSHLIQLDLTNTQLGSKGGLLIAKLLRHNDKLQNLNLSNNALGTKGIERFCGELASNSTLKILNLSYNNIKSRGATLLAQALEKPTSTSNLQSIDLSCNSITQKGMQTLSQMLTVNSTIESLYMGKNKMGPEGAAYLAFAMKRNYTMKTLHIQDNQIGPDAASLLFDQLIDDNQSLEDLNLAWNKIGTQGANDLAEVFTRNSTLTSIDFSGNQIGSDGVKALMDGLFYNLSIKDLNLSSNQIDDRGAHAISDVLGDPKSEPLQTIDCADNPDISPAGQRSIDRAPQVRRNREHWLDKLTQNIIGRKVRSINLTKRKVGNEEVLLLTKALNNPLIQDNPPLIPSLWLSGRLLSSRSLVPLLNSCVPTPANLVRLYFTNCYSVDEETMDAFANLLPQSKALEVLSLTSCRITQMGARKIAEGLRRNESLRRLNVDDNEIGDEGLDWIASLLPHKSLTSLSVNNNGITDAGVGSPGLSQVEELHLKGNLVTDRGALDFARNLMDNGNCRLTWLSLQNNQVSRKGGETIRAFLPETIPGATIVDY